MKQVTKVIMFVWRRHDGQKEFFVLHRHKGDKVVLTGHVGDHEEFRHETIEQAARRETIEELGVEPLNLQYLQKSWQVDLAPARIKSTEHAFLVEIPNQDVHFLEGDDPHQWHSLSELPDVLTYPHQKDIARHIIEKYS
jgi:8-oxo-dGTP pyrophosphatase MutT (NUDIX family)